eukprot:CAMPEP_0203863494 /NCGR_PEP_ID=MMETSP0359-20131031/14193_1 /ASSEMBLY_ACC=CAM_ASM_000338 /TAXON_ID=268821 /ORGANISM="Scrippsiella Hangoei, Strain SHTV-5" /LENGTH=70 /DNA_ID=CAMNT_0050781033 /DNA_START=233 /DNA_END=446 /DNA_ORIENTATION=+
MEESVLEVQSFPFPGAASLAAGHAAQHAAQALRFCLGRSPTSRDGISKMLSGDAVGKVPLSRELGWARAG